MIDSKLITFINVAKFKSYTKTAEFLNLTQPAVTQHIKLLEDYYNVHLIAKKGRQIYLTEEGLILLKYAREMEAWELALERELKNKSSVIKRYNIGATLTIGEFVLPDSLGEYKKHHNNIDVIMNVNNLDEVLKRLRSGEIDLGIVEGPFDKSKFICKKYKDDELVLAVSPSSCFAECSEVNIEDIIESGKLILREKGSGTRKTFENKLAELGFNMSEIKIYMEIGNLGAIKSLVEADLGITVISREAIKREVSRNTLKVIPVSDVKFFREFNFVRLEHSPVDFIEDFTGFLSKKE
jgi:Transcriptional regulator